MSSEPFWSLPTDDVLRSLATGSQGLSSAEAKSRLLATGPNRLQSERRTTALGLLARQFASPLVLLLAFAAVLSIALRETHDAVIILIILLASGLLGFWQEWGAADAMRKLLSLVAVRVRVMRDGAEQEVPLEEVVPGDVVLLSAGALVPADALLLESNDLFVDEAPLTGESAPAEKQPGTAPTDAPIARRTPALFLGTHVVSGTARAVVVRTGRETELGQISLRLALHRPEPAFERGIQRFGYLLMRVTVLLVLGVFAVNVFFHRPVIDAFLFSVALAVGLVPELLPAIVSLNLARGARRMARSKVIVKRLTAIENFGSMDVLCADKTGTLTEGKVRLHSALALDGSPSDRVLLHAALNATFESGFANPLDQAIRDAQDVQGMDLAGWRKLGEVPYDFIRKRLSVLVERDGRRLLVTKGALAQVLEVCTRAESAEGDVPLDSVRPAIEARFAGLSEDGLRTARRRGPDTRARRRNTRPGGGDDLPRLPGLLRPAQAGDRADPRRLRRHRHRIQADHGRQPARRRPPGLPGRHRVAHGGHRLRAAADERRGPRFEGRADGRLRRDRAEPEGAHHPGPAQAGPRRGLPRRRHQRRPGPPRGRRRHLRRQRRRRGQGGGGDRAARARPGRPGRRGAGGPADLRQHPQVRLHHHQRELRQHGEHGRGVPLPAVPAAAADPDPPQQFPLGLPGDGHRHRPGRPRAGGPAGPLETCRSSGTS